MSKRIWIEGGQTVVEQDLKCPECGAPMVLRQTQKFKWAKNGRGRLFYGCSKWPKCDGSHGAHPNGAPLGIPADKATKSARNAAHVAFDQLCLVRGWSKGQGYRWLGLQLGMPKDRIKADCHIAKFGIAECTLTVQACMREGGRVSRK